MSALANADIPDNAEVIKLTVDKSGFQFKGTHFDSDGQDCKRLGSSRVVMNEISLNIPNKHPLFHPDCREQRYEDSDRAVTMDDINEG